MNLEYHPLIPQILNRFSGVIGSGHSLRQNQNRLLSFGDATFRAEIGAEGTPYFSRVVHYPGGRASGVTIGAGFDMGLRSRAQVIADLTKAGVPYFDAVDLARGAGLRGESARRFVLNNRSELPTISIDAQRSLFEDVVTPEIISDLKRILTKNDLVESYGGVRWEELNRVEQAQGMCRPKYLLAVPAVTASADGGHLLYKECGHAVAQPVYPPSPVMQTCICQEGGRQLTGTACSIGSRRPGSIFPGSTDGEWRTYTHVHRKRRVWLPDLLW